MSDQTVLAVGPGQAYATIGAAIAAANAMGGNADIRVAAGTYFDDGGTIGVFTTNVTVEGIGGIVHIVDAGAAPGGGSAISVAGQNVTLRNLDISDVATLEGDGAGISVLSGQVLLDHVRLHNNQNGLQTVGFAYADISIRNSEIDHNGTGDGQTSNIIVGQVNSLVIDHSYIHDAYGGHEIESSATATTITMSRIFDNNTRALSTIDLPLGGGLTMDGNLIQKGAASPSTAMISWGEQLQAGATAYLRITNTDFRSDRGYGTTNLLGGQPGASAYGFDNVLYNINPYYAGAGVTDAFDVNFNKPILDTTSPFAPLSPTINAVIGIPYTGIRLAGTSRAGSTVTITDTAAGKTTTLGTTNASALGTWTFTSTSGIGRIDLSTVHNYSVNAQDNYGATGSMAGALILTDAGNDILTGTAGAQDVFAIMSFKGTDLIRAFEPASKAAAAHDVLNFSGRGLSSFDQLKPLLSGGADTIITLQGGKTITLAGVAPSALTAADFRFT